METFLEVKQLFVNYDFIFLFTEVVELFLDKNPQWSKNIEMF